MYTAYVHAEDVLEVTVTYNHILKGTKCSTSKCPLALAAYEKYGSGEYSVENGAWFINKFDE